jgi:LacI family gluconate utilization system Gnt-I transcriptional repressor
MSATLAEVARAAEVSVMTASRAIRDERGVSDAARTRVREAAEALGYAPDLYARTLASRPRERR